MNHIGKTWVELSASHLASNVRALKRHITSDVQMMAAVKANAYGHGLCEGANIAVKNGANWLGVDNADEGIVLRRAGVKVPILVLGYTLRERLPDCVKHKLSFMVCTPESVNALRQLFTEKHFARSQALIHLKIETGTVRQGIEGEELRRLVRSIKKIPQISIQGAYTHFANIEEMVDQSHAAMQLARFRTALSLLEEEGVRPPYIHTACSAASLLLPETYFNLVRIGIAVYGIWPSETVRRAVEKKAPDLKLKPVLAWKTIIAQIKRVSKGTAIGYGFSEQVKRDTTIAVLPVGYWDGYGRYQSSKGHVLIHGRRCKVLGRICMNMCMVDVTDVPRVRVEDEVILLGRKGTESVPAEEIAGHADSIAYEIVTRINPLIPRMIR